LNFNVKKLRTERKKRKRKNAAWRLKIPGNPNPGDAALRGGTKIRQ